MKKRIALLLAVMLSCGFIYSQSNSIHLNLNSKNVAVDGYDVVAYFKEKKAKVGNKHLKYTYEGAHYFFATEDNLSLFKASPQNYLPEFGGWCAYAMGKTGEKVEIDPESFLITDNKLFLFYDSFFNDTKEKWEKDPENLKAQAYKNWKNLY